MRAAQARTIALWSGALLAAAAGHAAVAAIALNWTSADFVPSAAPPPVVMISLAPPLAPQLTRQDVAPGPEAPDLVPEVAPAPPEKTAETGIEVPKTTEQANAAAVLTPPMAEPKPDKKPIEPEKSGRATDQRRQERRVASRAAAPTTFEAQRSPLASAPAAGAAHIPTAVTASWKSELMAQLNRHKRYPPGTDRTGTAMVAFSVNHFGEVTSTRLMRSSGDSALDQEAVSLPRRASPLPKPPAGIAAGPIALTVPIHFGR